MLKDELKQTKKTAGRRETRLSQCKTLIEKQPETLALQESNIAELHSNKPNNKPTAVANVLVLLLDWTSLLPNRGHHPNVAM